MNEDRQLRDGVLIVSFLLILIMPVGALLLRADVKPSQPRGSTEPAPAFGPGWKKMMGYPWQYRAWFREHFGLRPFLLSMYTRMRMDLFGVSSSAEVLLGQNGWLYYAGEKEGELNEYRSVKPFTDAELERMRKKLEAHQAWLASRGIQFLFLIAPDKAEIYAEYLPQWLRRVGQQNRLDQLLGYLRAHSTVDILDVRPALLAAKKFQPVFYKTDTHWNEVGAFLAYQQLAEKLRDRFPNYPTESLADFELVEVDRPGGDLARLLGRQEQMHETVMHLRPRTPCRAQWLEVQVNSEGRDVRFQSVLRSSCPGGEVPRAIVFRDSFAVMLLEFLAEHVEHMTSVWSPALDAELIEREKPNVVILEFVERGLRWNNVLGETRPGFEPGICPR